jgi:hypothetical protein
MVQTGIFSKFGNSFRSFRPPPTEPESGYVARCAQHPTDIDRHIFVSVVTGGKRQYARVMVSQLRDSPPHHQSSIDVSERIRGAWLGEQQLVCPLIFCFFPCNNTTDKPKWTVLYLPCFWLIRWLALPRNKENKWKAPLEFLYGGSSYNESSASSFLSNLEKETHSLEQTWMSLGWHFSLPILLVTVKKESNGCSRNTPATPAPTLLVFKGCERERQTREEKLKKVLSPLRFSPYFFFVSL